MAIPMEVPSWLQPPSEAEQQRLDAAAIAARDRASVMMKRYLGSQRMKADAQAAMANGVDQRTAMQNALLNNAHLLFADNPEAVSSIVNHEEANAVRERANFQLNQYREGMLQQKQDAEDRLRDRLNFEEDLKNKTLQATQERDAAKAELGKKTQDRLAQQNQRSGQIRVDTMLQTDAEYGNLMSAVTDAQKNLARVKAGRSLLHPFTSANPADIKAAQDAVDKAKKDLERYRQSTYRKYNLPAPAATDDEDVTDETTTAPDAGLPEPSAATNDVLNIGRFKVRRK